MITVTMSGLTENQQYGVAYAVKIANAPIIAENESITQENAVIIARNEGKPVEEQEVLKELKTLYTNETYIALVLEAAIDSWYKALVDKRKKLFENVMTQLPAEQIEALAAQLGVGNVL